MRFIIPFLLAHVAFAHPDHGVLPGNESQTTVHTGNGAWSYQAVPHWGELPDGKIIGPTHGGVVVDDASGLIYVSTDSELSVIVYQPDGRFLRTIAPECRGFHAMAIRHENNKPVIYGAQLNSNQPPLRICKIDVDGKLLLEIPNKITGEVPEGKPDIEDSEVAIIRWWIDNGADPRLVIQCQRHCGAGKSGKFRNLPVTGALMGWRGRHESQGPWNSGDFTF